MAMRTFFGLCLGCGIYVPEDERINFWLPILNNIIVPIKLQCLVFGVFLVYGINRGA